MEVSHGSEAGHGNLRMVDVGPPATPSTGTTIGEFVAVGAGLGAGVGSSVALTEGGLAGAAWTTVLSGAAAGLAASAAGGYVVGKMVYNSDWFQDWYQYETNKMVYGPKDSDPFKAFMQPTDNTGANWKMTIPDAAADHPHVLWICPDEGCQTTQMYTNPADALMSNHEFDAALEQSISSGDPICLQNIGQNGPELYAIFSVP